MGLVLVTMPAMAQTNQPSAVVADNFAKLFPGATKVEWKEKTDNFTAFFDLSNQKCEAKFAKTGGWLSTEETMPLDSLPAAVEHAFKACKYADWTETSAYSIQVAQGTTQYHLVVTRSDGGRKILFFSPDGNLLADR